MSGTRNLVSDKLILAAKQVEIEQAKADIEASYQSEIDELARRCQTNEAGLHVWSVQHPEEFDGSKSIDLPPVQPRRKYTLDGGSRSFGSPAQVFTTPKEERPMPPRQRKPATVTGPTPVAPPARPLSYCMHAIKPPTVAPTSLPSLPSLPSDDNDPF